MSGKTAREERREQRLQREGEAEREVRRRRLLQLGSAAAFLAVVAVAIAIVVSQNQEGGALKDASSVSSELAGLPQHGLVLGQPSAKVKLVEFGDLQCPVCREFAEGILPGVIDSKVRSGEAQLEFRNFTIISQQSVPAGAAAIAAGRQGHGWQFIELFYRNQRQEASGYVTDAFMRSIAKGAEVPDLRRWEAERRSKALLAEVARTTDEAKRLEFEGTPSFAVEGPRTAGLRKLGTVRGEELEKAIEEAR